VKVLHVIIGLDVGGAELMLKRLVELHINNPRYSHTVVSLSDVGVVGQQLRELGVEVVALRLNSFFQLPRVFLIRCQYEKCGKSMLQVSAGGTIICGMC
jgi:hypothetical protein